jgi:hypothetical protein
MRKSVFYIDGGSAYIGYTNGDRWNGWATPYFTLEEAQRVQADFSQGVDFPMLYDVNKDEFRVQYDDDEPYIWKGEDIQTVDGKLHLYGIGAYSHIWDELDSDDKRYLAQTINEFLLDYDTYEYRDAFDDEDEVIDALISQFANINDFAKAHAIMNNAMLGADEIYEKLGEFLKI